MASSHDIAFHPFTANAIRIRARRLCRRSDVSRSDIVDIEQDLRCYLLEKSHLFDPDRATLEAFVTNVVNTWMQMRLRHQYRHKRKGAKKAISLQNTYVECDGEITSLGNVLTDADGRRITRTEPMPASEQFELREAIGHVMTTLDPDDRALLEHVVEHGATSAARQRNVSRRQILNALARLRRNFEKSGLNPRFADNPPRNGIGNQ